MEATGHRISERVINIEGESWLFTIASVLIDGERVPVGFGLWSVTPFRPDGTPDPAYMLGKGPVIGEGGVDWPGEPRPVTSAVLRSANIPRRILGALATSREHSGKFLAAALKRGEANASLIEHLTDGAAPVRKPGRPPVDDERYRKAARIAVERWDRGLAALPEIEQKMFVSRSTAERLVKGARERGYLAASTRERGDQ